MGWEARRGGRYYYRAHRTGGRVRKEYVGPGIIGLLAEEDDRAAREERDAARRAAAEKRHAALAQVDADPLAELSAALECKVSRQLEAAGYRRHRGEWRRRRCPTP